jgi:hypothetical protein
LAIALLTLGDAQTPHLARGGLPADGCLVAIPKTAGASLSANNPDPLPTRQIRDPAQHHVHLQRQPPGTIHLPDRPAVLSRGQRPALPVPLGGRPASRSGYRFSSPCGGGDRGGVYDPPAHRRWPEAEGGPFLCAEGGIRTRTARRPGEFKTRCEFSAGMPFWRVYFPLSLAPLRFFTPTVRWPTAAEIPPCSPQTLRPRPFQFIQCNHTRFWGSRQGVRCIGFRGALRARDLCAPRFAA